MKTIKINYEITEYMERLHFEANMARREFAMAKKLGCTKEIICKACKRARIADIRFQTARQELGNMLRASFPEIFKWSFSYDRMEVQYD